jgi:hypothetical protein
MAGIVRAASCRECDSLTTGCDRYLKRRFQATIWPGMADEPDDSGAAFARTFVILPAFTFVLVFIAFFLSSVVSVANSMPIQSPQVTRWTHGWKPLRRLNVSLADQSGHVAHQALTYPIG